MMKKLTILVLAIILGGLGYAAYQHYAMQQSDNVKIQKTVGNGQSCKDGHSCNSGHCVSHICQSAGTAKDLNKITINPGQNSAPCKVDKDCNSGHCVSGLCNTDDATGVGISVGVGAITLGALPIISASMGGSGNVV